MKLGLHRSPDITPSFILRIRIYRGSFLFPVPLNEILRKIWTLLLLLKEQKLTEDIIDQWFVIDKEELVCHILTGEDIFESVVNEKKMEGSDVEMELEEEPVYVPTDQEALQVLETVIGWSEAQQDVEQVKIMQLVSLKNMILKKKILS
jgi:hypothetical protein